MVKTSKWTAMTKIGHCFKPKLVVVVAECSLDIIVVRQEINFEIYSQLGFQKLENL